MRSSVKRPLSLYFIGFLFALLTLLLFATVYSTNFIFKKVYLSNLEEEIKREMLIFQFDLEEQLAKGNLDRIRHILQWRALDGKLEKQLVTDSYGLIIFSNDRQDEGKFAELVLSPKLGEVLRNKIRTKDDTISTHSNKEEMIIEEILPYIYVDKEGKNSQGYIYFKANGSAIFQGLSQQVSSFARTAVLVLLCILLAFHFFFQQTLNIRIYKIIDALDRYYHQKEAFNLNLKGNDELSLLATYLSKECNEKLKLENQLDLNLKELEDQQAKLEKAYHRLDLLDKTKMNFLRQLSHELRTPLNGINSVEMLFMADLWDSPEREGTINFVRDCYGKSFRRLMQLIEHSCLLAELDTMDVNRQSQVTVNFMAIIKEVEDFYQDGIKEKDLKVTYEGCDDIELIGTYALYLEAFKALFDIVIHLSFKSNELLLYCVDNKLRLIYTGPKLTEEQEDTFFELLANDKPIQIDGDLGIEPLIARGILEVFGHSLEFTQDEQGLLSHFTVTLNDEDLVEAPFFSPDTTHY